MFLFALEREAAPFRRVHPTAAIEISGIGLVLARNAALRVIETQRPSAIICCGFAGALSEGLQVGDMIQAAEVIDEAGNRWPCTAFAGSDRVVSSPRMICDTNEKRRIRAQLAADAVDMESAAVAKLCTERKTPFGCVRVISDSAATQLSPRLANLLREGNISLYQALIQTMLYPPLIAEFLRLARDTKLAARKLSAALTALAARRG